MMRAWIGRRGLLAGGATLSLTGCATPPAVQVLSEQPAPYGQPDMVLVHNFAVRPEDVQVDPGLRAQIAASFQPDAYSSQQLDVAQNAASALAQRVWEALEGLPMPVERVPTVNPPGMAKFALIDGQMLAIDQGNSTQRRLVGFGAGKSRVEVSAQLWLIQRGTPPRLLLSMTSETDSGNLPGFAQNLGLDDSRRIGGAIADQVKRYMTKVGWLAPL